MSKYLKAVESLAKRVDKYITGTIQGDKMYLDVKTLGSMAFGTDFDDVVYTNPTTTTRQIELKLGAATIATYEITYADATRCEVTRIRKL